MELQKLTRSFLSQVWKRSKKRKCNQDAALLKRAGWRGAWHYEWHSQNNPKQERGAECATRGKGEKEHFVCGREGRLPSRGHCVRTAGANRIWVTGTKAIIFPRKVNKENTQSFTSATPRYLGGQAMRKLPKLLKGTKGRMRRVVNSGGDGGRRLKGTEAPALKSDDFRFTI